MLGRMITLAGLCAIGAMATGASSAVADECDTSYTAVGGKWSEAGNWQGGKLPTSAQNVCIPAGHGTVEVPFDFTAEAHRVTAESPLYLTTSATLDVMDAAPGEADASSFAELAISGGSLQTAGSWLDFFGNTTVHGNVGELLGPQIGELARLESGTLSGFCLLYTSDAADE